MTLSATGRKRDARRSDAANYHRRQLSPRADWYCSLSRSDRRNTLDEVADEMDALRREVETARADRKGLLARAAHEAWLKAKAGGSPDEIAAAVKALSR